MNVHSTREASVRGSDFTTEPGEQSVVPLLTVGTAGQGTESIPVSAGDPREALLENQCTREPVGRVLIDRQGPEGVSKAPRGGMRKEIGMDGTGGSAGSTQDESDSRPFGPGPGPQ